MQFFLTLQSDNPVSLPLNYGHYVQSMIYNILKQGGKYSHFLHDEGHMYGKRAFRMFTFGRLNGKHRIEGKTITFPEKIYLEVRSADNEFNYHFRRGLEGKPDLFLKNSNLALIDIRTESKLILPSAVTIKTLTPITVYVTEPGGRRSFISPEENDFERLIQANFSRKFSAFYNVIPIDDIYISLIEVGKSESTYFGNEKTGSWVFGWHGRFSLGGNPQYLEFLYNTGLGGKNSQGFGMFEIE